MFVSHAVDKPKHQQEQMSRLLQHLHECDLLTTTQAVKGIPNPFSNQTPCLIGNVFVENISSPLLSSLTHTSTNPCCYQGFQRLFQNINDLALDTPAAPAIVKGHSCYSHCEHSH